MEFKAGWGVRLWALAVLGGIAGAAFFYGLDETSDFPEEAAWLVVAVCALALVAVFLQQARLKATLWSYGLALTGLGRASWNVRWEQVASIAFDPTQGAFPFGTGIRLVDRLGHAVVVPRSIARVTDLGRRVVETHARASLAEVLVLLEYGDDICFGDSLIVNRDLMRATDPRTNHLKDYSLRDFRGAVVKAHSLEISLAGRVDPLRIKLRDLPNAHLLQPVLDRAQQLGPKIETALPVDHDQLEKTDAG
jgi:hypothetical protein